MGTLSCHSNQSSLIDWDKKNKHIYLFPRSKDDICELFMASEMSFENVDDGRQIPAYTISSHEPLAQVS